MNRRLIRVRATLTAPVGGITVYFKSFDLDDPSSNSSRGTGIGFGRYVFTARAQADLRPELEELAERFGQTLYYANLLPGEYHAGIGNAGRARTYLSRIAGKPDFPLTERAATRLVPRRLGGP